MIQKYLINIFFIIGLGHAMSQTPTNQDCLGAIPVCQNIYTQNNSFSGEGNFPNEITGGCLENGELNDVWYTVNVVSSGNLNFSINPNNNFDDYDWAVFNLTNATCNSLNASNLVSCSYSGTPGSTGPTGGTSQTSADPFDSPFNAQIPVSAGETYVINISNWSSTQNGYTLNFTNSTASIFDNQPPSIQNIVTVPNCGDSQIILEFNENITCSSINSSDLALIGPNGPISLNSISSPECNSGANYSNTYTLNLNESLQHTGTYNLSLNGLVTDICGNSSINDTLNFDIENLTLTVDTISSDCSQENGAATINVLGGTGNYNFSWSHDGSVTTQTDNSLFSGDYTVSVSDNNGCLNSINFQIDNNQSLEIVANVSEEINCFGDNNGEAFVTIMEGNGPYSFFWDDPSNQVAITAFNLGPGTYSVSVTSADLCTETAFVTINEPEELIVNTNNDTLICFGDSLVLFANAEGGNPDYIYSWGNGIGAGQSHTIFPSINTTYSVFVVDDNGCVSDPEEFNVNLNTPLVVNSTVDSYICNNSSITLSANGSGGNNGPYSYLWTPGGFTSSEITVSPNETTTYSVIISDDCNSIPDESQTTVNILPVPEIDIFSEDTFGCPGLQSNITFNGDSDAISSYQWLVNNSFYSTDQDINLELGNSGCYDIEVSVTDTFGCINDYISDCYIEVYPIPNSSFRHLPDSATILNPYFTFIDQTEDAESWEWNFGDGNESTLTNPFHVYADTGSYNVQLITTNEYGCTDTVVSIVNVDYLFNLYVPNSFSPNDDGFNDIFLPKGDGFELDSYEIFIYDRWGELVFTSDDINIGWDGTFKKQPLPQGVYTYLISLINYNGDDRNRTGIVTIIR